MKKSDDVFRLIRSMSRSEKRYFKVFASQQSGENKNYLLLFDAIDQQEFPDDDALRKHFADKVFSKQIHVVKNYLYKLILRSMRLYTAQKSQDAQIYDLLRDADFLTEKGHFDLAWKVLEKAEEQALTHERFILILEILRRQRELIREVEKERNPHLARVQMFDREKATLDILYNIYEYRRLSSRLFALMHTKGFSRDSDAWKEIEDIFATELIQQEPKALSIISRILRHGIRAAYFSAVGRNTESYQEVKLSVELIESCLQNYNYSPVDYIAVLSNYLVEALNVKRYNDFLEGLEKLRNAPKQIGVENLRNEIHIFRLGCNLELSYYARTAQFNKAQTVAADIEKKLLLYQGKIDVMYEIMFHYNLAILYYYCARYDDALRHLNHLITEHTETLRQDIFSFARIIMLFIHYELQNNDYLEHLLINISRYLDKRKRLYKYESLILKLLRRLRTAKNKKEEDIILRRMLVEFETLGKDEHEANAFKLFNIISWIKAKLENTTIRHIIEENNKQEAADE